MEGSESQAEEIELDLAGNGDTQQICDDTHSRRTKSQGVPEPSQKICYNSQYDVTKSIWQKGKKVAKYTLKNEPTGFTTGYRGKGKDTVMFLFCPLSYLYTQLQCPGQCPAENMHKRLMCQSSTLWIHMLQKGQVLMSLWKGKNYIQSK